jgi:hypothetical protein
MKIFAAVCAGFTPTPSLVMIALVEGSTLNSSAANFNTAVKGAVSGTLRLKFSYSLHRVSLHLTVALVGSTHTLNGSLGSLVNVILNVTLAQEAEEGVEGAGHVPGGALDMMALGIWWMKDDRMGGCV